MILKRDYSSLWSMRGNNSNYCSHSQNERISNFYDLIANLYFFVDKLIGEQSSRDSSNLLKVYCAVTTNKGLVIVRDLFFYMDPTLLIPFRMKKIRGIIETVNGYKYGLFEGNGYEVNRNFVDNVLKLIKEGNF